MSRSAIAQAPIEQLLQICEYLDEDSLQAFALTSQRCRSVANVRIFRKIRITIRGRTSLRVDVDYWESLLKGADSIHHQQVDEAPRIHKSEEDRIIDREALARTRTIAINYPDPQPPSVTRDEDDAWMPLAELVKLLPSLVDLVYKCSNQLSPCLLKVLHQSGSCRLHHGTFSFRSLKQPVEDSYELAIAVSPCLYSISAAYSSFDIRAEEDFNEEAILRTISGLAPKLREATMFRRRMKASPALERAARRPRRPWHGFSSVTDNIECQPGPLERLEVMGAMCTKNELELWTKHIDFATLHVFRSHATFNDEMLAMMVADPPFHHLTTLEMQMKNPRESPVPSEDYHQLCSSFFRSLPRLTELKICGKIDNSTFEAILERHGYSLHQLSLGCDENRVPFVLGRSQVKKILESCPDLEDLTLSMQRSRGDAEEVSIYEMLGAIPKLQKLSLTLDSSNRCLIPEDEDIPIPNDPSFDDFEQQFPEPGDEPFGSLPRNGHILNTFINSALDENLARDIFERISATKPRGGFPIESLTLLSCGGGEFGFISYPWELSDVFLNISRSWLLHRSPRDDRRYQVRAIELSRKQRENLESQELYPMPRPSGPLSKNIEDPCFQRVPRPLGKNIEPVFRRLWPVKSDSTEWRDDWYGLPLSESRPESEHCGPDGEL